MTRWMWTVGLALALSGCATADCTEECSDDADCAAGLFCMNSTEGQLCVPDDCNSCDKGCQYTVREGADGERACSYNRCY